MPSALRAAFIAAQQKTADARYAFDAGASSLRAEQTLMHRPIAFGAKGARIGEGADALGLRLDAVGCDGAVEPVAASEPTFDGNRATLAHTLSGSTVDEWYVNGPLGLEQGFTLPSAVACAEKADLVLDVAIDGASKPTLASDGTVAFLGPDGGTAYRYTDLHVVDAKGRELSGHMEVADGRVRLVLDARGAAYPLVVDPLVTTFQQELTASDGAAGDAFSVCSVYGDTAIIGAYGHAVSGRAAQGVAYVFTRSGGIWTQQQELTASDGAANDDFGLSVDLNVDTAVVGSSRSAYVFVRSGATFVQQQQLAPSDLILFSDAFGASVSVSGDTVAVGAPTHAFLGATGAAYVFTRSGTTWTQQQEFGPLGNGLGASVSLSVDTLLLGAPQASTSQGTAYVYVRSGTTWTQQTQLTAADATNGATFGGAVSVSGNTAVVGARNATLNSKASGAAYVYQRTGTAWALQQELSSSDAVAADAFGASLKLLGDTVVVGAPTHHVVAIQPGAAYVFTRSGTAWTQQQEYIPSDVADTDQFGAYVSLSASTVLVGAPAHDIGAKANQGDVYVYALPVANGGVCAVVGDCTSGNCVDGVCCDTTCGGGSLTDCQACSVAQGAAVDGTCGTVQAAAAFACRNSAGACDAAETCNGTSTACPADTFAPSSKVCRPAVAGGCDVAETCSGSSAACPADLVASNTTVCRAAASDCDAAETCDGTTNACPADVLKAAGAACTDDLNPCTTDLCNARGTCTHAAGNAGVTCRAAAGVCDAPETCTGATTVCPLDLFAPLGTVCRPAVPGGCDAAETCTGLAAACPVDVTIPNGTVCDDGSLCTTGDACLGGVCTGAAKTCPSDSECHGSGVCDPQSGTCSHELRPDGTACTGGVCTTGLCGPAPVTGSTSTASGSTTSTSSATSSTGSGVTTTTSTATGAGGATNTSSSANGGGGVGGVYAGGNGCTVATGGIGEGPREGVWMGLGLAALAIGRRRRALRARAA